MKAIDFGYYNQNFIFNAEISVSAPESGFVFQIARTGENPTTGNNLSDSYPLVSFSGYSGYIFDQSGDLVSSYRQNEDIRISGNYFYGEQSSSGKVTFDETGVGRFSFFINDVLIKNNISGQTGFFDTIYFDTQSGENVLSIYDFLIEGGSPCVLKTVGNVYDNDLLADYGYGTQQGGSYLFPSDSDYYLAASDCLSRIVFI